MGTVNYRLLAEKKTDAIEAGWGIEDIADYMEAMPALLEAIKDGVFDGSELKQIVKACFERRDEVVSTRPQRAALATTTNVVGALLGENGYLIRPAPNAPRKISFDGREYSKDDMIGKMFRTRPGETSWYLADLLVKIVSVGHAYMTVELMEDPQLKYPKSTELRNKMWTKGSQVKLRATNAQHIFETN